MDGIAFDLTTLQTPEEMLQAFQYADISLGQLASLLQLSKEEMMVYLSSRKIPVTDYDLEEDLRTISILMDQSKER